MKRQTARFKTSMWKDSEFTSLSRAAQWLYMSRKLCGQTDKFTTELACSWASDMTPECVENAAAELRRTSYGIVLLQLTARNRISDKVRQEVHDAYSWACVICGTGENLEIDHILPISKGGTDERVNLQTMCAHHNRKKGNRIDALV